MVETDANLRPATWAEDGDVIRSVRRQVFVIEQSIPAALDFDGTDSACIHALAFVGDNAVGTGRIEEDGHMGRIAVLKEWRGHRIGSQIVAFLSALAASKGLDRVYLNSQRSAVGFYEALGFTAVGDPFIEAGIEHLRMEKLI